MKYLAKKTITLIITLFIVSLLAFLAFQLIPGDPATQMLGTEATPERVEALREQLGLNRPLLARYFDWLGQFLFGDMGTSYSYSMPVREMLAGKIPVTACLTGLSLLLIAVFSIPLGIWQGRHAGKLPDVSATVLGQLFMSVPPFFLGIVFTLLFGLVHQNLTQTPFAFGFGLLAGYVAVEYSILWSMSLHILNNAVLALGLDALLRPLSGTWYWLAIRGVLFLLPLAVCLVLALVFRKKLAARRERDPIDPKWRRLFFRTPGWIIFLVLSCVCIILNFFVLGA